MSYYLPEGQAVPTWGAKWFQVRISELEWIGNACWNDVHWRMLKTFPPLLFCLFFQCFSSCFWTFMSQPAQPGHFPSLWLWRFSRNDPSNSWTNTRPSATSSSSRQLSSRRLTLAKFSEPRGTALDTFDHVTYWRGPNFDRNMEVGWKTKHVTCIIFFGGGFLPSHGIGMYWLIVSIKNLFGRPLGYTRGFRPLPQNDKMVTGPRGNRGRSCLRVASNYTWKKNKMPEFEQSRKFPSSW